MLRARDGQLRLGRKREGKREREREREKWEVLCVTISIPSFTSSRTRPTISLLCKM